MIEQNHRAVSLRCFLHLVIVIDLVFQVAILPVFMERIAGGTETQGDGSVTAPMSRACCFLLFHDTSPMSSDAMFLSLFNC